MSRGVLGLIAGAVVGGVMGGATIRREKAWPMFCRRPLGVGER